VLDEVAVLDADEELEVAVRTTAQATVESGGER
jgi:hypothetical protein